MGAPPVTDHVRFLIESLSEPSIYPGNVDRIEVIQTHISIVFIAGDYVYKIKKPLNLGFLDYTTLEKRRFFCQQEVTLNSRFSEGIYLDVVDIFSGECGVGFSGPGKVIEAAVLMKRIPEDRILKNLLIEQGLDDEQLTHLAQRLNAFHAQAPRSHHISQFGSPEVIHRNITENFEQARNFVGVTIEQKLLDKISSGSFEFLGKYLPNFRDRVKDGFIRDLHGDLHSEHIVFLDKVMLVDCIEFNDRFRYSDVISDIAFLLMDMDYLGFPVLSSKLNNIYAQQCEDDFLCGLYRFYKSYRAFVRGKVNCFALNEPEISPAARTLAKQSAEEYFKLSAWYLTNDPRPCLVVMCGLMGSGKSFTAQKLAERTGFQVLRSDVIRKQMLGMETSQHRFDDYAKGIYSEDVTNRTYYQMFDMASKYLKQGVSVILDASFIRFEHRNLAFETASESGSRFSLVQVCAPDEVIRQRLDERVRSSNDPSDGRWDLFQDQKTHFDEIKASELENFFSLDGSNHSESEIGRLVRRLLFSRNT